MKKKFCEIIGLAGMMTGVKFLSEGNSIGIIMLILSGFVYVMSEHFTSN